MNNHIIPYFGILGGTSFTPLDLPNLRYWFDATNSDSINSGSPVNNDLVGTWSDIGGRNRHLTQGTVGNKPTYKDSGFGANSTPHLLLDGAGDYMQNLTATDLTEATTIIVFSKVDNVGNQWILNDGSTLFNMGFGWITYTGALAVTLAGANNQQNITVTPTVGETMIIEADYNYTTGSVKSYEKGVLKNTQTLLSPTRSAGITLGTHQTLGTQTASMKVAEIIKVSGIISDENRTLVSDYLASKYL